MRLPLLVAALAGLLVARAPAQDGPAASTPPERRTPWSDLLRDEGLRAEDIHLSKDRWRGGGARSLRAFERAWDDWSSIESDTRAHAAAFIEAASSFERLLVVGADLCDVNTSAAPVAPVASLSLVDAIAALASRLGEPLDAARRQDLEARAARVPGDVAERASVVLVAIPGALDALAVALARFQPEGIPAEKRLTAAYERAIEFGRHFRVDAATLALLDAFDRDALYRGARELARALDVAGAPLEGTHGAFTFEWPTPIGTISLGGDGADRYEKGPYLLAIDTGGDDVYRPVVPEKLADYPLAISIDFAGDDRYSGPGLAFGAAILGYAFLLDVAGDDRYEADDVAPGSGIFGVGISIDRAGRDRYSVNLFGQGGAVYGVGVLADLEGSDEYRCLSLAQGYAGTYGCGALVDLGGDDLYVADDEHIKHPSPQTAEHNTSLAQGCGFGRRADPGDGHSLAGGVGLLVDAAGDDRYRCGVFGQGTAYWYALGALVDLAGRDDYQGVWYVQGSSAHYAVAVLIDAKGDDRYRATTQSIGQGHDCSIGLLADLEGDDDYACPGAGLGWAHWNSIALFRDGGGKDRFAGSGQSFGWADNVAEGYTCSALFVAESEKATFEPARPERVKDAPPGLRRLRRVR